MTRIDVHTIRREQILCATERLIARKGWAGTTFADICKEAEISNGVLTYHFKDKDEILLAVLEKVGRENHERLKTPDSLPEKLNLIVCNNFTCREEQRELGLLTLHFLSLAAQRPEFAERMRQIQAAVLQQAQAEIERAMEQKQIEKRDPAAVAAVLDMILMGISFGSLSFDFHVPTEQLIDEVLTLLRRYLGMGSPEKNE